MKAFLLSDCTCALTWLGGQVSQVTWIPSLPNLGSASRRCWNGRRKEHLPPLPRIPSDHPSCSHGQFTVDSSNAPTRRRQNPHLLLGTFLPSRCTSRVGERLRRWRVASRIGSNSPSPCSVMFLRVQPHPSSPVLVLFAAVVDVYPTNRFFPPTCSSIWLFLFFCRERDRPVDPSSKISWLIEVRMRFIFHFSPHPE